MATDSEVVAIEDHPPRPPTPGADTAPATRATPTTCEPYRQWFEEQVQLGRNAQSIYQDLIERHQFAYCYNSAKRFFARLRWRDPERFDVLKFVPTEKAQVDLGLGAPTLRRGKCCRPSRPAQPGTPDTGSTPSATRHGKMPDRRTAPTTVRSPHERHENRVAWNSLATWCVFRSS